jgi:hypothetical protein
VAQKMISEFLGELSESTARLAEYALDQEGVLARSGLSPGQQKILLTNDLKKIRDAIRGEHKKSDLIVVPLPVQHVASPIQ